MFWFKLILLTLIAPFAAAKCAPSRGGCNGACTDDYLKDCHGFSPAVQWDGDCDDLDL